MKHYPKNPRQITKEQFADLRDSLRKFGDLSGIVHNLNTDEVIGGNQRMEVFDLNKCQIEIVNRLDKPDEQGTVATGWVVWEGKRYTYRAVMWDERQAEEANIRANKAGGTWDWDTLANNFEIPDLLNWGFSEKELQLGGFDLNEPEGDDPGAQMDKAEELRQKWGVQSGQLWRLGEHRLICGDCTDRAVVARVMGGEKADTLISDPPYGIGYEYDEHDDASNEHNLELVQNAWKLAPIGKVWTCGMMNLERDLAWNPGAKVLCWHKGFAQAGNGLGGAGTWEPVLVIGITGGTLPNDYLSFPTDRIPGLRDLHSCPKPVELFDHLIQHLAGEIVYEPFLGSGTTLIACERLHRKCRAVEISPAYVSVALERFYVMTGIMPELIDELQTIDRK